MAYSGGPSGSKSLTPEQIAAEIQNVSRRSAQEFKKWVAEEKITLRNLAKTQADLAQEEALMAEREALRMAGTVSRNNDLLARQLAVQWATYVSSLILQGKIQTNEALIQALSLSQAKVNARIATELHGVKIKEAGIKDIFDAYVYASQLLGTTGFVLFVNSGDYIPPIFKNSGMYRHFVGRLQEKAIKNIYAAFGETIIELCKRADELTPKGVAWPKGYTQRLVRQAEWVVLNNKIGLEGSGSVENWRLSVNFNKLLGDPGYLYAAGHLGALLANQEERLYYKKNNMKHRPNSPWKSRIDAGRVTRLPSPAGDDEYKNPAARRYQFFVAMAVRKQKIFYGPFESRRDLVNSKRRRTPKILRRLTDRLADLETRENELGERTYRDITDIRRMTETMQERLETQNQIADIKAEMRFRAENQRRGRGIPISPTAWDRTVATRLNYWEKNNVAPMWYYLEFGQLRWQPIIPPMAFTYKFLSKARVYIDRLVKGAFDEELAWGGAFRDRYGRLRATGTPIYYGTERGQILPPGTLLNKSSFYRDLANIDKAEKQAIRNRDEAFAVASRFYRNKFNPLGPIVSPLRQQPRAFLPAVGPRDTGMPREADSYPMWESVRYTAGAGRIPLQTMEPFIGPVVGLRPVRAVGDLPPSTFLQNTRLQAVADARNAAEAPMKKTRAEHEAELRYKAMIQRLMVIAAGGKAAYSRLSPAEKLDLLHKVKRLKPGHEARIHKPYRAESAPNWTRGEKKRVRRKPRVYRRRRTFDEHGNLISDEQINEIR